MKMIAEADRKSFVRFLLILGLIQLALGLFLFICGGLAVRYTEGEESNGRPYYVGTFLVGSLILIASVITLITIRKAKERCSDHHVERKGITRFICAEIGLCVATVLGSFIGLFFVDIFGLNNCDPNGFGRFKGCNYTENINENHLTAIFITAFITASVVASLLSIGCYCWFGSRFGIKFTTRHGPMSVVERSNETQLDTYQAASVPVVTDTRYLYSPVVMGEAGLNAVGQPLSYSTGTQLNRSASANLTLLELQEQNRFLQEQIRLQQQQLELQQQLQPQEASPINTPPPPSYEQCISDDAFIRQMEEHNRELRNHCQAQQQKLEIQMPVPEPKVVPSTRHK